MFALLVNGMPMDHCERRGVFYSIADIKLNAHTHKFLNGMSVITEICGESAHCLLNRIHYSDTCVNGEINANVL